MLNRLSTDHANDDHPIIQIVSQSENQSALKACVKASNKQTGFKNQSNIHFEPIDTKVIPTSGQNNSCGHRTLCYIIAQNLFSNNNSIEIEYADPSLENSTYTKDDILAMHNTHNGSARHFIEQVMTPVVNALEKKRSTSTNDDQQPPGEANTIDWGYVVNEGANKRNSNWLMTIFKTYEST